MIVALAGGVGAAKFLYGLVQTIPQDELTVVVNTGDDAEFHGLHVSPDLDIVAYTLAGLVDDARGWGVAGDSFECLAALDRLGAETWFQLGDRDLATHIMRTQLLRQGVAPTRVAAIFARALGVGAQLLPMTDQRVATVVTTPDGTLPFQEYMVKRGAADEVVGVALDGIGEARPAPGVLEALREAEGIVICPSNPIISIGPILALPGVREAIRAARSVVVAISPIVAGRALKGPADRMLKGLGHEATAYGVAALYQDFVDVLVIDRRDETLAPRIEDLGLGVVVTNTIMATARDKEQLAAEVVGILRRGQPRPRIQKPAGSL